MPAARQISMQWSAEAIYARLPAGSRAATTWLAAAACFCRQVVEDLLRVPVLCVAGLSASIAAVLAVALLSAVAAAQDAHD